MKTLVNGTNEPRGWNHIATFGHAKLVTNAAGRAELIGGSPADRADAREWISLFLHDAVLQKSNQSFAAPQGVTCRGRGVPPTPPRTFWSGCRSAAQRLAMLLV